jgi:hypothetical protein
MFLYFLVLNNWDDSLLLDYIISPETKFLEYFLKYLKFTVATWSELRLKCEEFAEEMTSSNSSENGEGKTYLSNVQNYITSYNHTTDSIECCVTSKLSQCTKGIVNYSDSSGEEEMDSDDVVHNYTEGQVVKTEIAENEHTSGCSSKCLSNQNETLDKYMSVVIRLGLKINRMTKQKIFPFNSKPLLKWINQIEYLYEN